MHNNVEQPIAAGGAAPLKRLLSSLSAGLVIGVINITISISLAALIFSGPLAPYLSAGLGMMLVSAVVFMLVVGLTSSLRGIIAGPHVLHLVEHESVKQLEPVNTLAIALIALAGGAELRLEQLKRGLRSLMVALGLQTVLGMAVMAAVFFFARPAFVAGMPALAVLGVAILWGVVAITRSPASTLAS